MPTPAPDDQSLHAWYRRGRRPFWAGIIIPLVIVAVIVALDVAGAHRAGWYVVGAMGVIAVCIWVAFAVLAVIVVRRGRKASDRPDPN